MYNIIHNLTKVFILLSIISSPYTFAADDPAMAACVNSMKTSMKNSANVKANDQFINQFCSCLTSMGDVQSKSSDVVVSKCISRVLVINTITDFPAGSSPNSADELSTQCAKTTYDDVGTTATSKDDADIKTYCACTGPELFKLKQDDKATEKEMETKILAVGDQCASLIKQ